MKIRVLMATATAASVLMTFGALAANNAYLTQTGDGNSALVDQAAGEGNNVGSAAKFATQQGNNNALTVTQTNLSSLGVPDSYTLGVKQLNHRNVLTVTQNRGTVSQVQQTGGSNSALVTGTSNELTITQSVLPAWPYPTTIGNTIGAVTQTYTGTTGGADKNSATINQTRQNVGWQHANQLTTAEQDGKANTLLIEQTGGFHYINIVLQRGSTNTATLKQLGLQNDNRKVSQIGDNNSINVTADGTQNGALTSSVVTPYIGATLGTGGHPYQDVGAIRQEGNDNKFSLSILGSNNGYAAYQNGDNNTAENILITGSRNQLGIGQYDGNSNTILLGSITGNDNLVALRQGSRPSGSGDLNTITGSVLDDFNTAIVDQVGDSNSTAFSQVNDSNYLWIYALGNSNTLNATQDGSGDNTANVDVDGDSNFLDVTQTATASGNTLTAKIFGNGNNASGAFSGSAASVAPVSLTRGEIVQNGAGNSVNLEVGTLSADASSNLFAFSQTGGSSNSITAKIFGNSNQVVVVQVGSSNVSQSVQTGGNNNIGVSQ